jgi:hypothetical protein
MLSAPADAVPSLQDYYAAAMALFGIILFAKFATHASGAKSWLFEKKLPKARKCVQGQFGHFTCVVTAAIGAATCFAVLGWGAVWKIGEEDLRVVVAVTALLSGLILALDVGLTRRGGSTSDPNASKSTTGTSESHTFSPPVRPSERNKKTGTALAILAFAFVLMLRKHSHRK